MSGQKQAEDSIISSNFNENEHEGGGKAEGVEEEDHSVFSMKNALWHGGSSWDAWFSCSSNQVIKQQDSQSKKKNISFS